MFGDGVLIDTEKNLITLALTPGRDLAIREVYEKIVSAGYETVAVYLRIRGTLERQDDKLLLRTSAGSLYWLRNGDVSKLGSGLAIELQVHLTGAAIAALEPEAVVAVSVDAQHHPGSG